MNTFVKAVLVGAMSGMRSMAGPSTVSDYIAQKSPGAYDRFAFEWLVSPKSSALWRVLAIGEMGGDKAPGVPARIAPAPLGARAVSGGVSAASICAAEGQPAAAGALIGMAAAVVSAFGFYHLRKYAGEKLKVADPVLGAVEDGIVIGLRKAILS